MTVGRMAISSFLLTYAHLILTYWNIVHIKYQENDLGFISDDNKADFISIDEKAKRIHEAKWKLLTILNH